MTSGVEEDLEYEHDVFVDIACLPERHRKYLYRTSICELLRRVYSSHKNGFLYHRHRIHALQKYILN